MGSIEKVKSWLWVLLVILGSVSADQITKTTAEKHLMLWQNDTDLKEYQGQKYSIYTFGSESPIELVNPDGSKSAHQSFYLSLNFNYVRNQGAAWGALAEVDDRVRVPFFYLVTLFAVCIIFFYFRSTPREHRLVRFALVIILSGAIGNFLDRLRLGYVIDFIDVRWNIPLPIPIHLEWPALGVHWLFDSWRYNFPNFNWADSMISIGVFCLFIDMLFLEKKRMQKISEEKLKPLQETQVREDI